MSGFFVRVFFHKKFFITIKNQSGYESNVFSVFFVFLYIYIYIIINGLGRATCGILHQNV